MNESPYERRLRDVLRDEEHSETEPLEDDPRIRQVSTAEWPKACVRRASRVSCGRYGLGLEGVEDEAVEAKELLDVRGGRCKGGNEDKDGIRYSNTSDSCVGVLAASGRRVRGIMNRPNLVNRMTGAKRSMSPTRH